MKKIFLAGFLFVFMGIASAQTDIEQEVQNNQDRLQQEPPRDTQRQVDNAAKIEADKRRSNSNIEAEREAKDKGQAKNYTRVNPDKLPPVKTDSTRTVKPVQKPLNK